ncbi:DUF2268 domain-containing putative Zn-dependent protease [Sutcliffiella horikoshii]|uniref:DUF2268 domain-containing protein n=1 Tax=Sutcliffiella horikoshii TaxID=79883 RepID=A0ABN4ZGZ2_9BACI|nr:DUF2268 domain-containing putative Zn-dependent protease [Sutcliffiella horikoshii]ART75434.1 hypothetical protein B4U37_04965 [Sutcliffiella horikoshii]
MRVFLLLCLIVLSGCEMGTEEVTDMKEEELILKNDVIDTFLINGQEFEIYPWYGYYVEYLKEDYSSAEARIDNFHNVVGNPLSNEVLGYDYGYQNNIYLKPPYNRNKLKDYIVKLDERHKKIVEVIKEALTDSTILLSGGNYKIYLAPFNSDVNSEEFLGVTGFAQQNAMVLMLDPDKISDKSIREIVAHEYHHLVYMEISDYNTRTAHLLEKVIMEGKAETFTKILYPDYEVHWIEPLSNDEKDRVWSFMDENKYSVSEEDYSVLNNGSISKELPSWSNYRMGYQIMQEYLEKNPGLPVEEWTVLKAVEIIEELEFESIE